MLTSMTLSIILPALCAGLLIVATHVPLGHYVLRRGIIFVDLAIAQIVALGVIFSHIMHMPAMWQQQLTALIFALTGAYLLHFSEKRVGKHLEAVIGISYVLAATAGIILLAADPHGAEHFKHLLNGQILWVDYSQLVLVGIIYSIVLAGWFLFSTHQKSLLFYLLFAITVTISVQLVGIFLVFATLIIPALAVYGFQNYRLWGGYVIGILGYSLGLITSASFDLPTGAVIVWALTVVAVIVNYSLRIIQIIQSNARPLESDGVDRLS